MFLHPYLHKYWCKHKCKWSCYSFRSEYQSIKWCEIIFAFIIFAFFSLPAVFVLSLTLQFPVISQRLWHGEEEAAYLPHRRLREGLRENVSSPSSPALAQRREAIRLQLDVLREEVHQERRAAETQEDTHRWDDAQPSLSLLPAVQMKAVLMSVPS